MRSLARLLITAAAALLLAAPVARAQNTDAETGSLKIALELVQNGKTAEGLATSAEFRDPVARNLVTWLALRIDSRPVGFERANAFLRDNPDWPSTGLIRRRVETALYDENLNAATVRAFFAKSAPVSGEGKLALARALLAAGDRNGAQSLVRSAWRDDDLNSSVEGEAVSAFSGFLDRDDHKYRSDRLFYAGNNGGAERAAQRAGADVVALHRARVATSRRAGNANALINQVPAALRSDPTLQFARVQYRWRNDDHPGAAEMILAAPRDPALLIDTDSWWREVRIVARGMLDRGDARTAYRVAAHPGLPGSENYKADQHFTAGWIALRYLKDADTARRHFAAIESFSKHPITLGRAYYWQGRALEAAGDRAGANGFYQRAGRFSTTYYGQLARARLGLADLPLNRPVEPAAADRAKFAQLSHIRALRLLYATGQRDLTVPFYADLADRAPDERTALLLGAVAFEQRDPRGMVLVGKGAYNNGFLIDTIAFPVFGIPDHPKDDPSAERALLYAIARQESQFHQAATSTASAHGLMQVIPPTARAIARRLGIPFDLKKLRTDPVYNARLGANELGHLQQQFNGSYILTFVGYNAGPGRSREWAQRYGDPRDPKVDPVDWVERVPFSETRFYIQRVMENLQVYRVLFGDRKGLTIEADLSRGRVN